MPRLYVRKSDPNALIVCHRGGHYVSPGATAFTVTDTVTVTGDKGASTVTVHSGDGSIMETWSSKGTYTGSATASTITPPPALQGTGEPETELDRQLQEAQSRLTVRKGE